MHAHMPGGKIGFRNRATKNHEAPDIHSLFHVRAYRYQLFVTSI